MQETFIALLDSIEIWQSYSNGQYGLLTMYLHDWASPEAPWVNGGGIWFHSEDGDTGMVIWMREIADPLALLAAWTPEPVFGPKRPTCSPPAPGDRMSTMQQEWDSKTGACTNDAGSELTYEVSFLPNRDRVLEMLVYAPTGQWEYASGIFKTMLSLLTDIRH